MMDRYGQQGDNLVRTKHGKYVLWEDVSGLLIAIEYMAQEGLDRGSNRQREIRDIIEQVLGE